MTKRGYRKRAKARLYRTLFREAAATIDAAAMRQLVADLQLAGALPDPDIENTVARVCRRMRVMFLFEADDPREIADLAAAFLDLDTSDYEDLARAIIAQSASHADSYAAVRPALDLGAAMIDLTHQLGLTGDDRLDDLIVGLPKPLND
jgi:hypothetical protein